MRFLPTALAMALAGAPLRAHALGTDEKAAAEVLFNEGRAAMEAGRFEEACPKLAESNAIDRAVGTLGWLGQCYEKTGRTASAWATYREAAALARQRGDAERRQVAEERANALEPALSRLSLDTSACKAIAGLEITRNGKAVPPSLWSVAIPVDPGEQVLELRAPGHEPATVRVMVGGSGDKKTATLPALAATPASAPTAAAAAPAPVAAAATPEVASASEAPPAGEAPPLAPGAGTGGMQTQTLVGLIAGGAGVVGLGTGLVFLFQKNSKEDAASAAVASCPEDAAGVRECGAAQLADYRSLHGDAESAATLSTVSFIAGGVLAAAGVVLIVTAPSGASEKTATWVVTPVASAAGGGLWMHGTW